MDSLPIIALLQELDDLEDAAVAAWATHCAVEYPLIPNVRVDLSSYPDVDALDDYRFTCLQLQELSEVMRIPQVFFSGTSLEWFIDVHPHGRHVVLIRSKAMTLLSSSNEIITAWLFLPYRLGRRRGITLLREGHPNRNLPRLVLAIFSPVVRQSTEFTAKVGRLFFVSGLLGVAAASTATLADAAGGSYHTPTKVNNMS